MDECILLLVQMTLDSIVVPATRRSTLRWVTAPSLSLIHVHGTVNSLPDAIRHNSSLAVFKSSLRTYLFTLPDP